MTILRSPDDSGNPELELIAAARYQLRALSEGLLRLGSQLDINEIPANRWGPVVRTLQLVDGLSSRCLIAVAGEQGAGKTHLLTNLYPAAAGWLEGNIGRGEKTAVAVQERSDCTEARGLVVWRRRWDRNGQKTDSEPGEGLTYEMRYTFDQREQWRKAVMGEGSDVLLVVLEVPLGFLGEDGWGFALLPGFERVRDSDWQHLMKLVLATSPAALVVVDGAGLADATQAEILEHLRHVGGQAIEFVVAVSRCEELGSPDVLAQRVHRAMEVYGAREPDVIPVGRTRTDPANWPDRLHAALGRIRVTTPQSHQLEAALLRQVIRDDVQGIVNLARTALDSSALRNDTSTEIDEYMSVFDEACGKLRASMSARVHEAFDSHYRAACGRLEKSLEGTGWPEYTRRRWDWARLRPDEWTVRLTDAVDEAWEPDQAQQIQRKVIDEVADGMWRAYGHEFMASLTTPGQGQAVMALLGAHPQAKAQDDWSDNRGGLRITPALHALPGAALQARAFALRLAAPDGKIAAAPDDRKLDEIVCDIADDHRQLLTALSVLVGGAEPGAGAGDMLTSLTEIAGSTKKFGAVVRSLLSGGRASAVAGGATEATAGTAATASLAAPLAGVAASALVAVVIQAGNKAIRERGRLATARLIEWRTATEANILANTEELLRITRDIVERRLCFALGADEDLDRRFRLRQAIQDVRRDRALMLETLRDNHLG